MTEVNEGRKDDGDKPRMDLIPPELLEGTAAVLTFGAGKYGERNWEKGMAWGRPFGALMRHMWKWWGGEKLDPETNFPHLWHASCCVAFLMAYEARALGEDDRPSALGTAKWDGWPAPEAKVYVSDHGQLRAGVVEKVNLATRYALVRYYPPVKDAVPMWVSIHDLRLRS